MQEGVEIQRLIKPRTLIVEDDRDFLAVSCKLIDDVFKGEAVGIDNGYDAYQYLNEHYDEVDLIVCDFKMPEFDGLEFLKTVRQGLLWENPFVIITMETEEYIKKGARLRGATGFISKRNITDLNSYINLLTEACGIELP